MTFELPLECDGKYSDELISLMFRLEEIIGKSLFYRDDSGIIIFVIKQLKLIDENKPETEDNMELVDSERCLAHLVVHITDKEELKSIHDNIEKELSEN
jgi:hypothetical protein